MKEYMLEFSNTLDIILAEETSQWRPLQQAMELVRKLDIAKQMVLDLQHRLLSMKNRINADLALNIRRRMPALNVGLDKNGFCKVGYKTKHLLFSPDIEKGIWNVESSDNRFLSHFLKSKRSSLVIGAEISPLIEAVVAYFTNHYKSLGEDIDGVGAILIDGRIGTLSNLVQWKDGQIQLNSRSTRQRCLVNA